MGSIYDKLLADNLLNSPPSFLKNNIHYEVLTGSVAYGCNNPGKSDIDVYGFAIPPRDIVFPHTKGLIYNFDKFDEFNQFQQHHIKHPSGQEYDITIFNIVQFFKLCKENNPNMLDSLYPSRECVLFTTRVGERVRENADIFLTKHAYHKFSGYAASQLHKMRAKAIKKFIFFCDEYDIDVHISLDEVADLGIPESTKRELIKLINEIDKDGKRTKRIDGIRKYGFDLKFAYNLVRLQAECEQILTNHTLVLNRDREIYKAIRRGDWTEEQVVQHFDVNEKRLKKIYDESTLRNAPDVVAIRQLLIDCLEMHYGSISDCITSLNRYEAAIRDIQQILINHKC